MGCLRQDVSRRGLREIWDALFTALALARQAGLALAQDLGYEYPLQDDQRTIEYLCQARVLSKDAVSFDGK